MLPPLIREESKNSRINFSKDQPAYRALNCEEEKQPDIPKDRLSPDFLPSQFFVIYLPSFFQGSQMEMRE